MRHLTNTRLWALVVTFTMIIAFGIASSAVAAVGWSVQARTLPTNLIPGSHGYIEIGLIPLGAGHPEGPITVTDTLPAGLTLLKAGDMQFGFHGSGGTVFGVGQEYAHCSGSVVVTCVMDPSIGLPYFSGIVRLGISVAVDSSMSGSVINHVEVTGGGAPEPVMTRDSIEVSSSLPRFGFEGADATFSNADGTIATRAGSHPYEAIFSFTLNNQYHPETVSIGPSGEVKDLTGNLPPGFIGNPHAAAQCTQSQLNMFAGGAGVSGCPLASQVGIETSEISGISLSGPIYNMVPPPGAPAEFAFVNLGHARILCRVLAPALIMGSVLM